MIVPVAGGVSAAPSVADPVHVCVDARSGRARRRRAVVPGPSLCLPVVVEMSIARRTIRDTGRRSSVARAKSDGASAVDRTARCRTEVWCRKRPLTERRRDLTDEAVEHGDATLATSEVKVRHDQFINTGVDVLLDDRLDLLNVARNHRPAGNT